jgi:hypothetical protein
VSASGLPGFPAGEHRAIGADAQGRFEQFCACSMGRDHALGARGSLDVARKLLAQGPLVALQARHPRPGSTGVGVSVPEPQKAVQRRPRVRRRLSMDPANRARAIKAAAEGARLAQERLDAGGLPERYAAVLRLRVDHPEASYAELAEIVGDVSKETMAGRLRRALAFPAPTADREAS